MTPFEGQFYGNFHTIGGLEIKEGGRVIGLFGVIGEDAEISALNNKRARGFRTKYSWRISWC